MASFSDVIDRISNAVDAANETGTVTGGSHGGDKPEYPGEGGQEPGSGQYEGGEFDEKEAKRLLQRQMLPQLTQTSRSVDSGVSSRPSGLNEAGDKSSLPDGDEQDEEPSYWDTFQKYLSDNIGNDDLDHDRDENEPGLAPSIDVGHVAGEGDTNMWGQRYKEDPIGPVSQAYVGNTRNNDRYEQMFRDEGMSDQDLWETSHNRKLNEYEFHENKSSPQDLKGVYTASLPVENSMSVDDGTLDYGHLTSPKVMGSRLQEYARNGMAPGLTADQIEQITPDMIYDKAELAADPDVRFIPYMPNDSVLLTTAAENPVNLVAKGAGEMSNLRGNISEAVGNPYMINYGDASINGPEFDRGGFGYADTVIRDIDNDSRRLFVPHDGEEQSWTQYADRYQTVNPNGDVEYHYGIPTGPWSPSGEWIIEFDDGTKTTVGQDYVDSFPSDENGQYLPEGVSGAFPMWSQSYTDGSTATVTNDWLESMIGKDGNLDIRPERVDVTGMGLDTARLNGGTIPEGYTTDDGQRVNAFQNAGSVWLPNYVMEDGTTLTFDDVANIIEQKDGVSYDFDNLLPVPIGPFGYITNRPLRLSDSQPIQVDEEGNVDWGLSDLGEFQERWVGRPAERVFDLFSGSSPIMLPPQLSMPIAMTNGIESLYGANDYDPVRNAYTYNPENTSGAIAQAMTPINEMAVGPVGEGFIRPLSWMLDGRTGFLPAIGRGLLGAGEEGLEEILGNFFDEYGKQGLSKTFGPYLDEEGNVVEREYQAARDEYGRPVRQEWDPDGDILRQLGDRLWYSGLVPMPRNGDWYDPSSWTFQPDAAADNVNSFYGGSIMSLPGSLAGSLIQDSRDRADERDTKFRLEQMGLDGMYEEPVSPMMRREAPEEYLDQWRTMPNA